MDFQETKVLGMSIIYCIGLTWKRQVCTSNGKASKVIAQMNVIRAAKTYKTSLFWLTHKPCNLSRTSNDLNSFKLSTSTSGNHTWKLKKLCKENGENESVWTMYKIVIINTSLSSHNKWFSQHQTLTLDTIKQGNGDI